MRKFKFIIALAGFLLLLSLLTNSCTPQRNHKTVSTVGANYKTPDYNVSNKNVLVIADNDGTEIFDMMAPYHLFNATEKANVFIVAENKSPIIMNKGLYVLPQFTFSEIDSLHIVADVIVIPNQSVMIGMRQKRSTIDFIKNHYTGSTRVLSVCDGSITAAATGLYDGKYLTTHSSDYAQAKKQFTKPSWIQQVRFTNDGNLFSTAGISNATEGSLAVINDLFGRETMQKVLTSIHYPFAEIQKNHQSMSVNNNPTYMELRKGKIRKNTKVGVLLQSGMNEFDLAAILDTYRRSFPESIETYIAQGTSVTSKYGLTLLATGNIHSGDCTELHVLQPGNFSKSNQEIFGKASFVKYDNEQKQYIIDICLARISGLYGADLANVVKLMLDYN